MGNEREEAVLHLLFLSTLVSNAFLFGHINEDEAALHHIAIAQDIVRVCDRELTIDDVRQEALSGAGLAERRFGVG